MLLKEKLKSSCDNGLRLEYGPEEGVNGIDYLYEHTLYGTSWRKVDDIDYLIWGSAMRLDNSKCVELENVNQLNELHKNDIYVELHAMGPAGDYVNLIQVPDYVLGMFRVKRRIKFNELTGILELGAEVEGL